MYYFTKTYRLDPNNMENIVDLILNSISTFVY